MEIVINACRDTLTGDLRVVLAMRGFGRTKVRRDLPEPVGVIGRFVSVSSNRMGVS